MTILINNERGIKSKARFQKHLMVKFDLYSKEYAFRGSSMVEQETVNFKVLGSSPSRGARLILVPRKSLIIISDLIPFYYAFLTNSDCISIKRLLISSPDITLS